MVLPATIPFLTFPLDGEQIPNCTEKVLQKKSVKRAFDIERVLLSLPPSIRTYPLWIHPDKTAVPKYGSSVTLYTFFHIDFCFFEKRLVFTNLYNLNESFKINNEKTFGNMVEELKSPDHQYLNVTPPLRLKDLGLCEGRLVLLSEGTQSQCAQVISDCTYTVCF